jgi:hypothetical protein
MLLAWIIGVRGLVGGCGAAMYLRGGASPDVAAVVAQARDQGDPYEFTFLVLEAAQARALIDFQVVTFPLSVARMLLGGMLLAAAGLALGGKPGSRTFALLALAANAAFAAIDYALTRGMRGAWIDMVVRAGAMLPRELPERESLTNPGLWWMVERVRFVIFELGALAAGAIALTRERSRAYFEAVAEAAEGNREP